MNVFIVSDEEEMEVFTEVVNRCYGFYTYS